MTDDRQRTAGRDRVQPVPPTRQQQAPPPAVRRIDRGPLAAPPPRLPGPVRRALPLPEKGGRPIPPRRPPQPSDAEPATRPVTSDIDSPTRPVPSTTPADQLRGPAVRGPAPVRTSPAPRPPVGRSDVTTALPTPHPGPPPRPGGRPAEPPTTRNPTLPPSRSPAPAGPAPPSPATPGPARPAAGRPAIARPEPRPAREDAESTPARNPDDGPRRTLGRALAATAAATLAPGSGHLILRRVRTGSVILGTFVLIIAVLAMLVLTSDRAELLETALSANVLVMTTIGCIAAALAWIGVIVRTFLLARPRTLAGGQRVIGIAAVTALCMVVAAPLGFGANLANSQRNLLNSLFAGGGGTAAAEAISKPRLNVLLVGSDAGPDRTGTRTDTMMVASIDTKTGRTVLFGLPRNIGHAQFPPDSPMGEEFPDGFHDDSDPLSGNYLLNAVYAYGHQHPKLAPSAPTADPGLNMLHQTVAYMLGLQLDYYVEVNMAGFASIIDALGGLTVDVGPERIPIGGITPSGRHVRPDGYIEPGVQQLSGEQALAFARSRTDSSDYARMGRQRCLLQNILKQKSPADLLANFQGVASATTNSISTNIPQAVLPALAALAGGEGGISLESVSFDPNLPDPSEDDGWFKTGDPNFTYLRQVVQDAINRPPAPPAPPTNAAPSSTADDEDSPAGGKADSSDSESGAGASQDEDGGKTADEDATAAPTSLAEACG
jgi:polyisoprenyl-teichoic acid--peptidoglycan teichoic acid transferase